jgi:hypothetical protein
MPEDKADQAFEFQLEEFKALRREIEMRSEDQRLMERSVILGDAAIYALLNFPKQLGYEQQGPYAWVAWYVPSALAFLALVRWLDSLATIRRIALYTRQVEQRVMPDGGWEMHMFDVRRGEAPAAASWHKLLWPLLVGAPLMAAGAVKPILSNQWLSILVIPALAGFVTLLLLWNSKRQADGGAPQAASSPP